MTTAKCLLFLYVVILFGCGFARAQNSTEDSHARAIRLALEAGGMNTKGHPLLSKNYGPFLSKLGFSLISPTNYIPRTSDIRVFQPYADGDPIGHIDAYDGNQWVSDFKEANFWPSAKYKKYHPNYQIFRWLRK
jgi:hypothetical protein